MNLRELFFYKKKKWYHATSLNKFYKIMDEGILFNVNEGKPLDFGSGFYLSPSKKWARGYAENFFEIVDDDSDDSSAVIIEFRFMPINLIKEGMTHHFFKAQDLDYARFTVQNWLNPGKYNMKKDIIAGPMTDGNQLEMLALHDKGIVSEADLISVFIEETGENQLLLHTQRACDAIRPYRATTLKGDDLDVTTYKKNQAHT